MNHPQMPGDPRADLARIFPSPDEEFVLTKKQVAGHLQLSVRTIEHFISARRIAVIRFGSAVRIEPGELARFKKSLTVKAETEK